MLYKPLINFHYDLLDIIYASAICLQANLVLVKYLKYLKYSPLIQKTKPPPKGLIPVSRVFKQ